jgi:hypothetical protein
MRGVRSVGPRTYGRSDRGRQGADQTELRRTLRSSLFLPSFCSPVEVDHMLSTLVLCVLVAAVGKVLWAVGQAQRYR